MAGGIRPAPFFCEARLFAGTWDSFSAPSFIDRIDLVTSFVASLVATAILGDMSRSGCVCEGKGDEEGTKKHENVCDAWCVRVQRERLKCCGMENWCVGR